LGKETILAEREANMSVVEVPMEKLTSRQSNEKASNRAEKPGAYRWAVLFLTTFTQSCDSIITYGVATIAPFRLVRPW
jgi:hypothetical protein